MDAVAESTTIERELVIAARPETIWELLTDPQQAIRWMGCTASFDLRRGGAYRVEVIPGNVAAGQFVEIDPPRRLVYTWGWESGKATSIPPGSSTVTFELEPRGEGTLLRFSHRDLPNVAAVASHTHGWEHYLERLAIVAAGGEAGPDPWTTGPVA